MKIIITFIFILNCSIAFAGYGTGGGSSDEWTQDSAIRTTTPNDKVAIGTTTSSIALNVVGTITASTGFTAPNFFYVGTNSLNGNDITVSSTGSVLASFLNPNLADNGTEYLYFGKGDSLNRAYLSYKKATNGQSTNNLINFQTNASSGLWIRGSDNYVGINKYDPSCMLETKETSVGTGTVAMRVNYDNVGLAGSGMVQFTMAGESVVGSIDIVNDTTLAYNTFTGSHYTEVQNRGLKKYMVLESTGEHLESHGQCVKTKLSNKEKSKRIIGVYGGKTASGTDMVLCIGTGFIWVKNEGNNINVGDYLCSSNIPGYAVKQEDDKVRNYTVAKSNENVVWSKNEKKKLIACTYHGG